MAFYSIGDVAERSGINPVTLRAWQRRYDLLKPQRSEGGHRQFDENDILRIQEIKRWVDSGVPVGKVKALLDAESASADDGWTEQQDQLMHSLRPVQIDKLRSQLTALAAKYPADILIDRVLVPLRQRLNLNQHTARTLCSLLDGILIEQVSCTLHQTNTTHPTDALLMGWGTEDRPRLWLEAWRLSQQQSYCNVLAEPLEALRPELFPQQRIFIYTGKEPTRRQLELLAEWQQQGLTIQFHCP